MVEEVAVALAGFGSAECRATGAEEVLVGLGAGAMGNVPVPGSVTGPTGGESRGGVAGAGGQRRAWDGAPVDDLAVASPAQSVGDAENTDQVSKAAGAE